jgi:hypothetical protein
MSTLIKTHVAIHKLADASGLTGSRKRTAKCFPPRCLGNAKPVPLPRIYLRASGLSAWIDEPCNCDDSRLEAKQARICSPIHARFVFFFGV